MVDVEMLREQGQLGAFLTAKLMDLTYEAEKIDDFYYGAVYCNCTEDKCPMIKSGNIFDTEDEAVDWARNEVKSIVVKYIKKKKKLYEDMKTLEQFPIMYLAANEFIMAIDDGEYKDNPASEEEIRGLGNMVAHLLNKIEYQMLEARLVEIESK